MKKRIILIIGIIVALFAIWQTVMGEPLFSRMIIAGTGAKLNSTVLLENSDQ